MFRLRLRTEGEEAKAVLDNPDTLIPEYQGFTEAQRKSIEGL